MSAFSREDEASSRWKAIIESAVDGIVVIDSAGAIEAFNPAAERLFGYRESEVVGQNVKLLMPAPYREEHDQYLHSYLTTSVPKIIGKGREVTARRQDGTTFPIHLSVGEMVLGGERKFTGIIHDLSERVAFEERLREQTALARLGEMAAVVAHEVKNPLAAIRAVVQTIGQRLPADDRARDVIPPLLARIDGLADLMQELLMFARPPTPRAVPVEIAPLIVATAEFVKSDAGMQNVQIDVAGTVPTISADPDLLKIVFLNLLINGGQAMEGRGRIAVDVSAADRSCRITFLDSGPGVPLAVRDKVFLPFFTTKPKGTGLGLATSKRLIEAQGGTIGLECPATGGTRVSVLLPLQ